MPNIMYEKLLTTAGGYFDKEKAKSVIDRQLPRCNATPDNFTAENLKAIMNFLTGSLSLYVPDQGKRDEMIGKLNSLT